MPERTNLLNQQQLQMGEVEAMMFALILYVNRASQNLLYGLRCLFSELLPRLPLHRSIHPWDSQTRHQGYHFPYYNKLLPFPYSFKHYVHTEKYNITIEGNNSKLKLPFSKINHNPLLSHFFKYPPLEKGGQGGFEAENNMGYNMLTDKVLNKAEYYGTRCKEFEGKYGMGFASFKKKVEESEEEVLSEWDDLLLWEGYEIAFILCKNEAKK